MRSASADRIVALGERLEDVAPEILGMLETDACAKESGRHTLFALPTTASID
jgi:hypothetical protein